VSDDAGGEPRVENFCLGEWSVWPRLNQLSRRGNVVHLRPKVMDVLVYLAEHGGVVSKDEIIAAVWAKKFLADSALSRAVFELREVLGDDAQQPAYIETIAKRGYRLIAPVAWEDPISRGSLPQRRAPIARGGWYVAVAAAAVSVLTVVAALIFRGWPAGFATGGSSVAPRIAVVPFENLAPPEDEYLAAGITEEITGRLADVRGLSVISARTGAPSAGNTTTTRQLAAELKVDYLLTGTVRWDRGGGGPDRVRIIPRLIRAKDDTHVWAEVYDRVVGDVLAVQREITEKVIQQLDLTLNQGERDALGRLPTSDPEAYQVFLRGVRYAGGCEGDEAQRLAVTMFARAVELDPAFAAAWRALSEAEGRRYHYGFDRSEERRSAAKQALDRAVALAPEDPETHLTRARYSFFVATDSGGALAELDEAERRGKPTSETLAWRGYVLRRLGRYAEARDSLVRALELAPRDSLLRNEVAITDMFLGRYAEADRYLSESAELTPDQHTAFEWRWLDRLLWQGSLGRARTELAKMPTLRRSPVALAWWLQEICEGHYEEALRRLQLLPGETCALQYRYYPRSLMEADVYKLMGERRRARDAYDVARGVLEAEAARRPEDPRIPSALGLAYAGLGRRSDALHEANRALVICPEAKDATRAGFAYAALARIHLVTGDREAAARLVERLLTTPTHPSAVPLVWLDPRWAPLRDHPRLRPLKVGRSRLDAAN
jgi:TolB-like protein/DNA-binding winged helix-turn-helix (wHTH) protein/tetratricopeptide (TPR) repeat protein